MVPLDESSSLDDKKDNPILEKSGLKCKIYWPLSAITVF